MSGFRSLTIKIAAVVLVAGFLGIGTPNQPDASAVIDGGPPCCTRQVNSASSVMREYLEELWDAPGDVQVAWLRGRLEGQDYDYVLALRAVLAGHCLEGCEPELAVATEALNDIVEQRYREQEMHSRLLGIGLNGAWAIVAAIVGALFGARLQQRRLFRRQLDKRPLWLQQRCLRRTTAPLRWPR